LIVTVDWFTAEAGKRGGIRTFSLDISPSRTISLLYYIKEDTPKERIGWVLITLS